MEIIKQLAPNQFYFITDNKIVFQSYQTIVCTIENFENANEPIIKITENQPQSKTTAKYLNKFLALHTSINNYKTI
jgi:predicted ABC-type transport system involved in lysophospholipase L1 biosynthesis ATPase subunit